MKKSNMKLNSKAAGIALAAVLGGLYVICLVLLSVFPMPIFGIGANMFHGVQLVTRTMSMLGTLSGLIAWLVVGFIAGFAFAKIYNKIQ